MSHLVEALWDELWFVNMGYTTKIWLIDWLKSRSQTPHLEPACDIVNHMSAIFPSPSLIFYTHYAYTHQLRLFTLLIVARHQGGAL